jgi:5-methylphenazine-1-carboxylate 1-monooxygenase
VKVIVAGAGIGGLSAALSLHAAGIEALVIDSAAALRPLGVGINLMPHAVRELTELGLGGELEATGIPTAEMVHFDRHGNRIWGFASGRNIGYRWPQYSIHRGELQMILLGAVRERLGPSAVRTGTAFVSFAESPAGVLVRVRDRPNDGAGRCSTGWPRSSCRDGPRCGTRAGTGPTGTGRGGSTTCCRGSPTGSSAGWTCPR